MSDFYYSHDEAINWLNIGKQKLDVLLEKDRGYFNDGEFPTPIEVSEIPSGTEFGKGAKQIRHPSSSDEIVWVYRFKGGYLLGRIHITKGSESGQGELSSMTYSPILEVCKDKDLEIKIGWHHAHVVGPSVKDEEKQLQNLIKWLKNYVGQTRVTSNGNDFTDATNQDHSKNTVSPQARDESIARTSNVLIGPDPNDGNFVYLQIPMTRVTRATADILKAVLKAYDPAVYGQISHKQ